ncbi:MAG: benzoyl-CoA reductase subunit A [Planctomycetes bacterium]|nr:benzoyl-CoA reductase subunit A [Planctomycetota bacterium]
MHTFLGIDLGSTTTKAVVLDENENVLGRGITNSRSNYDVACAVARREAYVSARFAIFRSALQLRGAESVEKIADTLDIYFRLEQHLQQLSILKSECEKQCDNERFADKKELILNVLSEVFEILENDSVAIFSPGASKHSDFFRDIAGSGFMREAERLSDKKTISFDALIGVYDKAIIIVENEDLELDFSANIYSAKEKMLIANADVLSGISKKDFDDAVIVAAETEMNEISAVGTGYGRQRLPFPKEQIRSEILCHGLGAHHMFPGTRTVLDIGGQDTKAIQVDGEGVVTSFQMNDRCAAGCGRYLGYIADEMNLGLHELGPMAQKATKSVKINSTCTVFAGAELRDRLAAGQNREDILQGLHRAIIVRAMSLLARSGGIESEFTFTGGVAKNEAATAALRKLVFENYGEMRINISPDSIYTGALGASLFALRDAKVTV